MRTLFRAAVASILTLSLFASLAPGAGVSRDTASERVFTRADEGSILVSSRSGVRFKAAAGGDSFYLYGGPGSLDGKFQDGAGLPDVLGHAPHDIIEGKWFGVDLTEQAPDSQFWQVADFCAETLDGDGSSGGSGDGPGNLAWWAGKSAAQEPGWDTPPGYGNNWNAQLTWRQTVANAQSTAQTVGLTFAFHHDTEPAYDFFNVEYDSAGVIKTVFSTDGSNTPFAAPGVQYPHAGALPITYAAGGYGGDDGDEIVIRLTVTSDGGWSDEDGQFDSVCGAAIVDDITVTYDDGNKTTVVDFSDVDNTNSWSPGDLPPFFGDFSQIFVGFEQDFDVCRQNSSPMAGFLDDGSCPRNQRNNGGEQPCLSTGGSTSTTSSYGVPGGWVVNYTGGISDGILNIANEIWSPEIAWDLPGTVDDDPNVAGTVLRFSVWRDLPLLNGMYWIWRVRSSVDGGDTWSQWRDNQFFFTSTPTWFNNERVVTSLLEPNPTHVQVALGVLDLADLFAFPGTDARPSPMYDNVSVLKHRLRGPVLTTRNIDLFMDAFPQSGETDFHTLAGRENADCRIDMRDISSGMLNTPGDSMIVDVVSRIPGTVVDEVKLRWVLDKNPKFDDVRVMPPGVTVVPGGALNGWDQWTGEIDSQPVLVDGTPIDNRHAFDLPDQNFAHPGDVLRYYVWSSDNQGNVSTLPAHTGGFETGRGPNDRRYEPRFTVNFLPSVVDDGQGGWTQPTILMVNDFGFRGGLEEYYQAFEQNGWRRGTHWDMYSVWGPTSSVSNGIGSAGAHGATSEQLAGYEAIVYVAGDLGSTLLSEGTNTANNDKGDDLGTLRGWFEQDADRFIAHFGDDIASAISQDSPGPGADYVASVMGIDLLDNSVRDDIDDQTAPGIVPAIGSFWFGTRYAAYGGCLGLNEFDNVEARLGAARGHDFTSAAGLPYGSPGRAASILYDRIDGLGNRKASITFPYGLVYVWDEAVPEGNARSSRARLLAEILEGYFARAIVANPPTDNPAVGFRGPRDVEGFPNPFNPNLTISFELGRDSETKVSVYNLRGQKIATVHQGMLDAGRQRITWNGTDDRGASVASGVYVLVVDADGKTERFKATLLK